MSNPIIQEVKLIQLVWSTDDFPTSTCDWLKHSALRTLKSQLNSSLYNLRQFLNRDTVTVTVKTKIHTLCKISVFDRNDQATY